MGSRMVGLQIHQMFIQPESFQVYKSENGEWKLIQLTPIEYKLLVYFVEAKDRVLSRENLKERIWKKNPKVTDRSIDSHICTLRKKIGFSARYIRTLYGTGYILVSK